MFKYSLEVEANMMASGKIKHRVETRKIREDGPSTYVASSNDVKFEMMMKKMEKLMDRLTVYNSILNRGKNKPHIRNPNFRRKNPPPPPQIRQRDIRNPRNPNDQQIQPPFSENYVDDESEAETIEDKIHHFGDLDSKIYGTKEEHNMYAQEDGNKVCEEELEQYQRGYLHAMDDVQRKIKFRSRDVVVNKGSLNQNQPCPNLRSYSLLLSVGPTLGD